MKLFLNKDDTKQELRKLMKILAINLSVKNICFNNQAKKLSGYYHYDKNLIFINNKQSKKNMLQTFFHELAHHCSTTQQEEHAKYHKGISKKIEPTKAFCIENKTDKLASALWKKHVDTTSWGKYNFAYPKSQKKQLTKWLDQYYNK